MASGLAALVLVAASLAAQPASAADEASPGATRINRAPGHFVPVPEAIPHAAGAYVDRRLIPNLRWITENFDVFVLEGFAGKLPDGTKVGCPKCHVESSEHKIGLAVDLAPLYYAITPFGTGGAPASFDYDEPCDRRWKDTTRLALWAEPQPGVTVPPFRWVGYDGNPNHGCGHHLHLSWVHDSEFHKYEPSAWVEVFKVRRTMAPPQGA